MRIRFWEIDTLRGIAVILMIFFNYSFALSYLGIYKITDGWIFWWLLPRAIATTFIIIAGISFAISYSRTAEKKRRNKFIIRAGKIFFLGLIATAATAILYPQSTILFGILHFLGFAILLAPFFVNLGKWNLGLSIAFILIGIFLSSISIGHPWLLWLGIVPENFQTFDYFPLLPWLGIFLIGLFIGSNFYGKKRRNFSIKNLKAKHIEFIGRHSLLIYAIHQPILIAVLYIFGFSII